MYPAHSPFPSQIGKENQLANWGLKSSIFYGDGGLIHRRASVPSPFGNMLLFILYVNSFINKDRMEGFWLQGTCSCFPCHMVRSARHYFRAITSPSMKQCLPVYLPEISYLRGHSVVGEGCSWLKDPNAMNLVINQVGRDRTDSLGQNPDHGFGFRLINRVCLVVEFSFQSFLTFNCSHTRGSHASLRAV